MRRIGVITTFKWKKYTYLQETKERKKWNLILNMIAKVYFLFISLN